jgi:hypothetical protein
MATIGFLVRSGSQADIPQKPCPLLPKSGHVQCTSQCQVTRTGINLASADAEQGGGSGDFALSFRNQDRVPGSTIRA